MDKYQILHDVQDQLDQDTGRSQKPRETGITMVIIEDVANFGPDYVAPFQELVDRIASKSWTNYRI